MEKKIKPSNGIDFNKCLHIIYGSRTGNSKSAAQLAEKYANHLGLDTCLLDMKTMNVSIMANIKNLLLVVSTHGEGDPPAVAQKFYNYLHHTHKASLNKLKFSVLALGDSSYKDYCKTGKDFEKQLKELGAQSIFPLVECDVDYEKNAKEWIEMAVNTFSNLLRPTKKAQDKLFSFNFHSNSTDEDTFQVIVKDKYLLTHPDSDKKTFHISLSSENLKLSYLPGDSIGIPCHNSRFLVDKLLKQLKYDGTYSIGEKGRIRLLKQVLIEDLELTLITPLVIKKYAELIKNDKLEQLISNQTELEQYCERHDILDLVTDFPSQLNHEQFLSILRPLKPRLYSVASSCLKYPNEVHLTLRLMKYSLHKRQYIGVSSSFLSDRIDSGESMPIYLEENISFRLPENKDTPIIMIGNGTGIAPYRAFLQERDHCQAKGDNWLIFGERSFKSNYLYKEEILDFKERGILTRLDTAFSQDQKDKIYVQDKIIEYGHDIYDWLINRKAVIYLCGSKRTMAKGVRESLLGIFCKEGQLSIQEANDLINELKMKKQWQEDVY